MRRHLAALGAATTLTASLLVGTQTGAEASPTGTRHESVGDLLAAAPSATSRPATQRSTPPSSRAKPFGRVNAPDQTLRQGCHRYRINYRITVPSDEWSAEIFVVNPNRRGLHAFVLDSNAPDPRVGTKRFELCRRSTVYGVHRLKMKVTYCPDVRCRDDVVEGFVKPGRFRLDRP